MHHGYVPYPTCSLNRGVGTLSYVTEAEIVRELFDGGMEMYVSPFGGLASRTPFEFHRMFIFLKVSLTF